MTASSDHALVKSACGRLGPKRMIYYTRVYLVCVSIPFSLCMAVVVVYACSSDDGKLKISVASNVLRLLVTIILSYYKCACSSWKIVVLPCETQPLADEPSACFPGNTVVGYEVNGQ